MMPALPMWGDIAARVRPVLQRLPMQPPGLALAALLNRFLRPKLPADAAQALSNRTVEIAVSDLGLVLRLRLGAQGFGLASTGEPVALRIAASAPVFLRLLRGEDDADRLFFERMMVMEGDTEFGLILKNTLDAIGPLWQSPQRH